MSIPFVTHLAIWLRDESWRHRLQGGGIRQLARLVRHHAAFACTDAVARYSVSLLPFSIGGLAYVMCMPDEASAELLSPR